jgi:hypothetical protein
VDGLRNYPEEPEQRWYSEGHRAEGDDRYDGYRVPDPRYEEPRGWGLDAPNPPPASRVGSEVPPWGADLPPATAEPERYQTQPLDRGALHRSTPLAPASPPPPPMSPPPMSPMPTSAPPTSAPPGSSGPALAGPGQAAPAGVAEPGGAVYRTRRAGVAALLAGAAIFAELLLVRLLLVAEFAAKGTPGGVLAGLFALAGVPLVTMGLHGLATGAASAGPAPGRLWLRVPLAYLPVGLVLLLAAALAVR